MRDNNSFIQHLEEHSSLQAQEAPQGWHPLSWQRFYDKMTQLYSSNDLAQVMQELSQADPLVAEDDILSLKRELADVYEGKKLYFQAGDCVELFKDANHVSFQSRLLFLNSICRYIEKSHGHDVVAIGRLAGQFAKPRSAETEEVNEITMHTFMGEMINDFAPNVWARKPQANRMLWAYNAARFGMESIQYLLANGINNQPIQPVFTSHEGLHLHYESSQTGYGIEKKGYFNFSSHMQWIGMRSLHEDSPHLEYFKGIENPIGVKIGPSVTPKDLQQMCQRLNTRNEAGKLVLITRFGASQVQEKLPSIVQAVQDIGAKVIWICDPMHANTVKNLHGVKTRCISDMKEEIVQTAQVHHEAGTRFCGLHLETSPDDIQECANHPNEVDWIKEGPAYQTYCDPRLNYEQTLNVVGAFLRQLQGVDKR
ncbi:3-deoxy-7-phosphoheptulonate synthase [Algicola sagamiensis]|uniref:3-deoxy-7-phosphoheptulonate synthase n=1 Tax=Algicola sagamiensis TaxID=163869 RepID=UPI00146C11C2|nr:3-deoxy-7-phosphoheptulonate synthase [Algicola sagamiensis]